MAAEAFGAAAGHFRAPGHMTLILTAALYQIIAVAYAVFAVVLAVRGLHTWTARYFAAALVGTALWAQSSALTAYGVLSSNAPEAMNALRDGAWLSVCLALMYTRAGNYRFWWVATVAGAILVSLQVLLSFIPEGLGTAAGIHIDTTLMCVCITILGFALIENVLRNSSAADFWAVKHWAIGLSGIFLFQLIVRIPEFLTHNADFGQSLATPLVFLIVLPFFVVSSTRIPQVRLRFHSSRAFVFHTATLLGAGVLLQGTALAAWYVRSYGGTNATALAIVVAFTGSVSVAAAISSATVRSRVRLLINEYFFSFKYDYRVEWETVIRGLTSDLGTPIAERALRVLCNLLDAPGGSIWLYRESWRQFISSATFCMTVRNMSIREDDPRIETLRNEPRPLVQLDLGESSDEARLSLMSFVDDGWIVVPLRQRSALVGFAVLAKPRVDRSLDWEDEALIRLVAMQVTAYLVQEETSQSLADARQLDDFNRRFAFIVHDIKNTIGQLSLMVRNISQFGDRKDFRDDMVITLGNAVDRLVLLLTSLTAVGSQASGAASQTQPVDLNKFLGDFCEEKRNLGHPLNFHEFPVNARTNTDGATLRRVLEHVLSNALEASQPGSSVDIALKMKENLFEIGVADRGAGMTQQFINEELFRPLKTTKRGGSGLGAFQIRELMRDLGGDVIVESRIGEGTEVTLFLPRH
jgi:putative PEP-CTERM system histidine kinase